jgi:hypothetical protein
VNVAGVGGPVELTQMTIEQRVIIRIPLAPRRAPPPPRPAPPVKWKEKKGPDFLGARSIRGADVVTSDSLDIYLLDGQRYRAKLEKGCQSADFYSGFYIEPSDDGAVCAGRDELRARGGTSCEVDSFKRLVQDK